MDIGIVSKRYAKALYAYALERGSEVTVYAEMQTLVRSYLAVPQLRQALENPVLTRDDKVNLLCQAVGSEASEPFRRFATLVLDERREKFMQFIAVSFIDLYRQKHNIHIGKLTTATAIDDENLEQMKQLVVNSSQGTVEFETQIDPTILGGFILDVNFNRLDASIANQLSKVQKQFVEKNKRIV